MISERHHFHFFGNKEINALYFSLGLLHFGESLISVFVPIYFLNLGIPIPQILLFYFLHSFYFVVLLLLLLGVIKMLSDKMMMFLSIPLMILYFFGLGFITEVSLLFYILPALLAGSLLLFNIGYHMEFSGAADKEYIGREVGTRFMIGALSMLTAPFIGGILI